jgi:molecular chaperone HtpG
MEEFNFTADITELMNMIIHNFYSNKDIFIRELISNSSDAINKVKFNSLQDQSILEENYEFNIKIKIDKDNSTITIQDTGIGMTKDDLINNLGTIAKSGTKDFIKRISETNNLIGQFGVGFYSAYLVAETVTVITKYAGSSDIYKWESDANGKYILEKLEDNTITRGTKIILKIKEDSKEYLNDNNLINIIKKHSSYISYPILLHKIVNIEIPDIKSEQKEEEIESKQKEEEIESEQKEEDIKSEQKEEDIESEQKEDIKSEQKEEDIKSEQKEEEDDNDDTDSDKPDIPDSDSEDDDKINKKYIKEEQWIKINIEPIWTKKANEVTKNEYTDFYKSITNEYDNYLTLKHFTIEGNIEFTGLLYVPKSAPYNMFDKNKISNIKLYVKKVLITDNCIDLYPEWMSFVKGVIDSQDLPLNASRELLQESKILKQIKKHIIKKSLEMVSDMSEEEYKIFYENYNKNIKLGINHEEDQIKDKLIDLLRFNTSNGSFISFKNYIENMKESQPGIYFITGDNIKTLENSAFIDKLKKLNYEIIYMIDAIDEYIIKKIFKYNNIKLINVARDDLSLNEEQIDLNKYSILCDKIKTCLGDKIELVLISNKIESQPAIITNKYGMSANMERIIKAQALNDNTITNISRKNLEINVDHPIIKRLYNLYPEQNVIINTDDEINDDDDDDDDKIKIDIINEETTINDSVLPKETTKEDIEIDELINFLYESALLASGYQVEDINMYLKHVFRYVK